MRKAQNLAPANWKADPSFLELIGLLSLAGICFAATAATLGGWRDMSLAYGDTGAYLEVAEAIRNWDLHSVGIQHFMGYPYAIAMVSLISHLSLPLSLMVVAGVASVVSTVLVARLFGTRVAAFFALTNFAWIQISFLGGSEPLAIALAMGALWTFRRDHTLLAVLLGALATTVRPLMFFTLAGIGITLLLQKRYRKFGEAVALGSAICLLYMWPLIHFFGDPLLTVHSYTSRDYGAGMIKGPHGHLFGWPFHGIIAGTIAYPAPWTNLILSFAWIALVIAGLAAMFRHRLREYWRANPAEAIFCGLYALTLFSYDYLIWARSNFMRFSIPILPFIFFAMRQWLPKDRRVLWGLALVAPMLAACSAYGIINLYSLWR